MEFVELYVLDKDFITIATLDTFESLIWTDRYRECGDFELYCSVNTNILPYLTDGYYMWQKNSQSMMIIESIEITTDVEQGNKLKVTGRSLESLLERRIIWHRTTVSGKVQDIVKKLINDAIINPALAARKINNFVFIDNPDTRLTSMEIEEIQYLGDNLYDVIIDILSVYDLGFQIVYNYAKDRFECGIYLGIDRSYNQTKVPPVIFSPEFDNIITSDYIESSASYKNVNLICGEEREDEDGHQIPQKFVFVDDGTSPTGLDRREMFTDGSGNNQEYTDENQQEVHLTDAQYIEVLKNAAITELSNTDYQMIKSFDGQMNTTRGFKYGYDFEVGDIVQMENEFGLTGTARVTEMIYSQSTSGVEMYPTFSTISDV